MPYLKFTVQLASPPFLCSAPWQYGNSRKLSAAVVATRLGTSAGSTTWAPCAFSSAMASAITFACSAFSPPCGSFSPGGVTAS